jgi:chitodextrinase
VTCTTIGESAVPGSDYTFTNSVLSWANGDATDKNCSVPILNDTVIEPLEIFYVNLSTPTGGATTGPITSVSVSVVDDDAGGGPDTVPPTGPGNLVATPMSTSQINLSWNPSTDNVGVTGYRLERCTGNSCNAFTQIATPATTGYSDPGLASGTSYSYRVRATDPAGNFSGYSLVATTSTNSTGDTQKPSVPGNLVPSAISGTQINLTWAASTDNVGVTGYNIERCTGASCAGFAPVTTVTTTSYSNTGLSPATTYVYRVSARDAAGNVSDPSSPASATTIAGTETTSYQYDALGRLRVVTHTGTVNNNVQATYTLDPAGNRSNVTVNVP